MVVDDDLCFVHQAGLSFIAADVAQLVKSGIGESERQLVEMFQVPLCSVELTQSEREDLHAESVRGSSVHAVPRRAAGPF